jgi:hypothetical protein
MTIGLGVPAINPADTTMESEQHTVREGFRVVKTTFIVPENIGQMDPQIKRKATICNLFVNHQLAIADVIRVLDESYSHAIGVLIDQGVKPAQCAKTRSRFFESVGPDVQT